MKTCRKPETIALVRVPQTVGGKGLCCVNQTGYSVWKTADGFDLVELDDTVHSVEVWGARSNVFTCTCREYRPCHHKAGGVCRHTRAVEAMTKVTTGEILEA